MLDDYHTAPISEPLRAMLGYLEKLTHTPDEIGPADVALLRGAGLSDEAIADAVNVCAMFNIYARLADAMGWNVPSDPTHWTKVAKFLLTRGYEGGKKPRGLAHGPASPLHPP